MTFDDAGNRARVAFLQSRGVDVWGPERVYVGEDVDLGAIEPGSVIRHATLSGPSLSIANGATIGSSGHAEVDDCQVGKNVELGSGLYQQATFLDSVRVRGFAEIRPGTLLEEQAEAAHNVALKNTTFTSCCIAGSLINFCDLFLSGGRSRREHTEIGSGAIHFNFDPYGDKWGSLIGGIRGVLLRSDPVFIGGNSGLVGPLEIGFGAVTAAGSIIRKDVADNTLAADHRSTLRRRRFDLSAYGRLRGKFLLTAKMIATLHALDTWYHLVRIPNADLAERQLYKAARTRIHTQTAERIARLGRIVEKLAAELGQESVPKATAADHRALVEGWKTMRKVLEASGEQEDPPQEFLDPYRRAREGGLGHVEAVHAAHAGAPLAGWWLDGLVDRITNRAGRAISKRRK